MITNLGWNIGKQESSHFAGGNANTLDTSLTVSHKNLEIKLPNDWAILLLGIYPNEMKTYAHKDLHIIHIHSQNLKNVKCPSIDEQTKCDISIQWNITHQQKKQITNTCFNIHEPQKNIMLSERMPTQEITYCMTWFI